MKTIIRRALAAWRGPPAVPDLERRVAHLEAELEGLQDAVYRQDVVHDRQIADLRVERGGGSA